MKNIGQSLRRERDRLGETQVKFAARFGVDQPTYCRWEVEERHPSKATVVLIERILSELRTINVVKCDFCQNIVANKRIDSRFCSEKCRYEWHNRNRGLKARGESLKAGS